MNPTQIELVQSTFGNYVVPLGDAAADVFYEKLFALDPSMRALFNGDMAVQGHKLVGMLAVVVNGLHTPETIAGAAQQLGQRHAGYGVQARHYDTVARCCCKRCKPLSARPTRPMCTRRGRRRMRCWRR